MGSNTQGANEPPDRVAHASGCLAVRIQTLRFHRVLSLRFARLSFGVYFYKRTEPYESIHIKDEIISFDKGTSLGRVRGKQAELGPFPSFSLISSLGSQTVNKSFSFYI